MVRLNLVICFILIGILIVQATVEETEHSPSSINEHNHKLAVNQPSVFKNIAEEPSGNEAKDEEKEREEAEAPVPRKLGKHHSDKSVVGGGVIIGGLVTAVFAAVFCYIRVTRRRDVTPKS